MIADPTPAARQNGIEVSARLSRFVESKTFQRTVLATILAAGALSGVATDSTLVARHGRLLSVLESAVLGIFALEIACKIGAYGRRPWRFFKDGWNIFDTLVVLLCLLPLQSPFASVLRLARVLRVLRLVSALPRLQLLVNALFKSIGAMGYVCLLLGILFYVYAVAGVQLFATASPALFGSLSLALFTLFRLMTLDNWSDVFAAVDPSAPIAAPLYFFSFILIGTTIMLNLFIGIVMKSMTDVHDEMDRHGPSADARIAPLREPELDQLEAQLPDGDGGLVQQSTADAFWRSPPVREVKEDGGPSELRYREQPRRPSARAFAAEMFNHNTPRETHVDLCHARASRAFPRDYILCRCPRHGGLQPGAGISWRSGRRLLSRRVRAGGGVDRAAKGLHVCPGAARRGRDGVPQRGHLAGGGHRYRLR